MYLSQIPAWFYALPSDVTANNAIHHISCNVATIFTVKSHETSRLKPPSCFVFSATTIEDEQAENWCSLLRDSECEKQEP